MAKRIAASLFTLIVVPVAGLAQQPHTQKLERIEVTGSSIKRLDPETAVPVQILRHDDTERLGATTTEKLLKQVTAITSFGRIFATQAHRTVTTSVSTVLLRVLGSN